MSDVATETTAPANQKTLLFYENLVPLNRDKHRNLRLKKSPASTFMFATYTNSVPLAGPEFIDASRNYPIVFAGQDNENVLPAVLLGLHDQENLFINDEGTWEEGYVPAFIRRYPFVLAETPNTSDFTVLVDEEFAGFNENDGEPLFDEEGKDSAFLQQAKHFLSQYQTQMSATREFVKRLNEYGLLIDRVIQGKTAEGEKYVLRGFFVVDEARLAELTDAQLRKLFMSGELAWLYAHLFSMRNLRQLSQRLSGREKSTTALEGNA